MSGREGALVLHQSRERGSFMENKFMEYLRGKVPGKSLNPPLYRRGNRGPDR